LQWIAGKWIVGQWIAGQWTTGSGYLVDFRLVDCSGLQWIQGAGSGFSELQVVNGLQWIIIQWMWNYSEDVDY
jgi:hypothetical protein